LAAAVATWVALGLLALTTLASCIVLLRIASVAPVDYPEYADAIPPLVALALVVALCVEVALVAAAILVRFMRGDRIFDPVAQRFVNAILTSF